ncbi:MAG: tetratricopeptide repeat protein [Desulfitobacteriaceae bacterium]
MSHPLASKTGNRQSQFPANWRQFLAYGQMLLGKNDEAIGTWVELLGFTSLKPRLNIVRRLIKAHVFAEVREYLEGYDNSQAENDAEIKYWLAHCYLGLGLVNEAKVAIEKATQIGPEKAVYWDLLADCLLEQGEWRQATEALDKSLRVDPKRAETVYRLGTVYAYNGELTEALRCFIGACQLRPRNAIHWEMKAEMHLQLEQLGEACSSFTRALHHSADPEIMVRVAYCHVQLNRIDKGMKYYERVLKHVPDHYDALCNLAAIYQNLGRAGEALNLLERAHNIYPNDPILLNNLAYTLVHLGRTRKATEYYLAALGLTPNHPLILYNLSVCFANKGEWEPGMETINKLLDIDPDHSDAWALLGNIYDKLDRPELAIDCFNRALKLA